MDLRCWMALAARSLATIAAATGAPNTQACYYKEGQEKEQFSRHYWWGMREGA